MALETLKGIESINGVELKRVSWNHPKDNFIEVNDNGNSITFNIQNGPIKENGKNGCQVEDMVAVAKHIIEKLNDNYPCRENAMMITKLDEAIMWSKKRTEDRNNRFVEGKSEK